MQQAEIRAVLLLSVVNAFEKPLGSTFNNHSGSSNLWLKYIFIHSLLFISVWSQIMWLILIFICGYFAQHRWYEARIEMISNIFFVVFCGFVHTQRHFLNDTLSLCSMKHCVQNTLSLGILERVHHSIPVTNHLPHGGGSCFHRRESLTPSWVSLHASTQTAGKACVRLQA